MVLWLILAVLLFGSGAVLGFFSTIFWIIVGIAILVGIIWFIYSLPKITKTISKEIIEDQKQAYAKHPTGVIVFIIFIAIFLLVLLIAWLNQSGNTNAINTQFQPQYVPTTQPEKVKQNKRFNLEKARAAGATPEQIQTYLQSHPDVYVYPEANRNVFLTSCYKTSENNITGCTCLLNYFQARYTLDEFLQIEAEYVKTQKSEIFVNASQYCAK